MCTLSKCIYIHVIHLKKMYNMLTHFFDNKKMTHGVSSVMTNREKMSNKSDILFFAKG